MYKGRRSRTKEPFKLQYLLINMQGILHIFFQVNHSYSYVFLILISSRSYRPDMTFAVDWALSNNYLSIQVNPGLHLFFQSTHVLTGLLSLFTQTENELAESLTRSKTMPTLGRPKLNRKLSTFNDGERLRMAKEMVEKAIKVGLGVGQLGHQHLLSP